MTRRTPTHTAMRIVLGCLYIALILAAPTSALAKHKDKDHHDRFPRRLWRQYPLSVHYSGERVAPDSKTPTPKPSPRSSLAPSPSASTKAAPVAQKVTSEPPNSDSPNRWPLFAVTAGILALAGAGLFALRRKAPAPAAPEAATLAPVLGTPSQDGETEGPFDDRFATVAAPLGDWAQHRGQRVRLTLEDGRLLEGYKRESTSANPQLVILDVLTAFDPEGHETQARPSDSFILRSEISSVQRLDDS